MTYFNTTHLTGSDLHDAHKAAQTQDAVILALYRTHNRPLSPSQAMVLLNRDGHVWPLTSIRRAITGLTHDGALVRLDDKRTGIYGKPEGCWALPVGQGEFAFGRLAG